MNFYVIVLNSCANIDLGMTDQYGNTAEGYRYYQHFRQSFVKTTQIRYMFLGSAVLCGQLQGK